LKNGEFKNQEDCMDLTRRHFIKTLAAGSAGIAAGGLLTAKGYSRILGANDRVRVAVVGFSDRCRSSLLPPFAVYAKELNFELVAVSDIWNRRREEGKAFIQQLTGQTVAAVRNNDELYNAQKPDAVIIATADFQHALHCAEAVRAGCDVYVEKPFAETMADARDALKAVTESDRIVQIGSQRRSGANYIAANEYIRSGQFGPICMVEMTWNVNQPGRWRRPKLVAAIRETDVDWKRFLMNRPFEPWDPRKYLEYRLFWPYSSGIPGQWMCHQIDTVHWFTGLSHPRSVTANGGIYVWKDGRKNFDTVTAVFDYGPFDDASSGFQAVYMSRMTNSSGGTKEWYFSNAGKLDLDHNAISSEGGLIERYAFDMDMKPNLLPDVKLPSEIVETAPNTGGDSMTSAHVRNWMECIRGRKTPHADVMAGYNHSIACVMATAALHTGQKATFDSATQEVMAGGKVFQY
jgi:predicted dehydrogenase